MKTQDSVPRFVTETGCTAGLPDGLFSIQNPNLGKFWRALDWKMYIYCMAIGNFLWRIGIFYDNLLYFVFIWYIFPCLYSLVSCTKKNLATLVHCVMINRVTRLVEFSPKVGQLFSESQK
jgi:hypothetical protein